MNLKLKAQAVMLRKQGLSYSEIMAKIPVAKSTLCDWLHSVGLAKHQKQRLTEKKILGQQKAAAARRTQRLEKSEKIRQQALSEINERIHDPFWLLGVVLYWGEGSKQKD